MRHHVLFLVTFTILFAGCKKDNDNPNHGAEEGKKIENTLIGQKYKIGAITDQMGVNAAAKFAPCIMDDRYLFKDRGTVEITQGAVKCGKEASDKKNTSWGVGYGENEVTAILMPYFAGGADYYQTRAFSKNLFTIDHSTGVLQLLFKVGADTYTIRLDQTL